MNVELIVNDEHLDLYANTAIALVLQSQNFNDLAEKQSSFSRSFTIPRTDKNNRILNNIFAFNIADKTAYRNLNGVLKVNGVEIGKGNMIVENDGISNNELRLTFYFDASPFYQLVSKINLQECNFNEFDHYYTYDNIFNSLDNSKDYIYPLIDYTDDVTKFTSTISTTSININTLLPAIKLPAIIKAIEKTTGYKFKGSMFSLNEYLTAIIPFSKSNFIRDKYYSRRYNFTTYNTSTQVVSQNNFYPLLTEEDTNGNLKYSSNSLVPFSPNYNNNPSAYTINNVSLAHLMMPDKVRIKIVLECTYNVVPSNSTLFIDLINQSSITHSKSVTLTSLNGTIINGVVSGGTIGFANNIPSGLYQLKYEEELTTGANWLFYFNFICNRPQNEISNLTLSSTYISDGGTEENDRAIKLSAPNSLYTWNINQQFYTGNTAWGYDGDYVTHSGVLYYCLSDNINSQPPNSNWLTLSSPQNKLNSVWSTSIVTAGALLPDVTVGSYLKTLAQLFCCSIIVDENKKEVEFFMLKDIYSNSQKQLDWTDKLVNIEASTWNTRATNYGQASIFKFANEENAGEAGQTIIAVDDTTLVESKVVIEIPYSSSNDVQRWTNIPTAVYIALIKRIGSDYKISGNDKVHICNTYTYQGNLGTLSYKRKDGVTLYTRTTNQTIGYSLSFTGITFDKAINSYYKYLIYLLNNYKELNCFMILSANDIANINYRLPIYLQQYSALFYLQKINDWSEGKPTKVELLKLI
jgi:hypothetical protein